MSKPVGSRNPDIAARRLIIQIAQLFVATMRADMLRLCRGDLRQKAAFTPDTLMIGSQLSANQGCRLFVSNDVDDTRERIAAVMQPHDLRPIGAIRPLQAQMSFLRLPGVGLGTIRFGRMALRLDPVEDYHLMIFCLKGRAKVQSLGETMIVEGAHGICLAPDDDLDAEFSEDCEQFVVRIDQATMRRGTGLDRPRLNRIVDLNRQSLRPWANSVHAMLGDDETIALLRKDQRIAAQFQEVFTSTLLHGHGACRDGQPHAVAPASVRRAEAYIEAHLAEPLTLADIATAAGVPVRTLLEGFRRFRDISPMRQLRDLRLDHARDLLAAAHPGTNVTAAAFDVGLSHLGRFAQNYRERFGETPTETLRRCQPD